MTDNTFVIESNKIYITDPCYSPDTWCSTLMDITPGEYEAKTSIYNDGSWGDRISELQIVLIGIEIEESIKWVKIDEDIGVDSGQAGFFDQKYYRQDQYYTNIPRVRKDGLILCESEPFYSICCDRSCGPNHWGVIPFGVVSSSGYGDGGYTAYYYKPEGYEAPVAFKLVFIGGEEDFEEESQEV